jgi:DNA-binding MarR family transcriptional regulator
MSPQEIVRCPDDLAPIGPFSDDLTRFVRRPDDLAGDSVVRMDTTPRARKRGLPFQRQHAAEHGLIDEITNAARRIATARDSYGEPVFRADGVWRVLTAVAGSLCCLAIADLARALGVRKQVAHELAHAAARAGVVELAPNHQDKRILQALLTPRGRAELAAARTARALWLATLLNGLGDHELAATTHVVRVIRQRLERDAREQAARRA